MLGRRGGNGAQAMRPLTDILKTGAWSGRQCFVVGSGPSLQGFDFSWLSEELTIGCNEEYKNNPTIALVQDVRAFKGDGSRRGYRDTPGWYDRPGTIPVYFKGHPDREDLEAPDTVYQAKSCHTKQRPFGWGDTLEGGLTYGGNCGLAALSLACALRADPIYLLGIDCKDGPGDKTHHHDGYPEGWALDKRNRQDVYARDIAEFEAHSHRPRGHVFSLNPGSALDCFPKVRSVGVSWRGGRWTITKWEKWGIE